MTGEVRIGGIKIGMSANFSQLEKDLNNAVKSVNKFGRNMKSIGTDLSKSFSGPILAIGGASILAAEQFDKAFATIRRGTGATGNDLKKLESDFRAVFAGVPESAQQVATAIADLNTRTGATGEQLQNLAKTELELARVTDSDVASVVRGTTRVFGDWGIKVEESADALDYLFRTSQSTGVGIDKLTQLTVDYGVQLRSLGFSFEEGAALIGKFEKEGVATEKILGALSAGIGKLLKAGEDPARVFEALQDDFKRTRNEAELSQRVLQIFGARAGADLAKAIVEGRLEIDNLVESLKNSRETIGAAAKESETFTDTLSRLKNAATSALEPLGEEVLKQIEPAFEGAVVKVAGLADSFRALDPETKEFVVQLGLIGAAAGPAIVVLGSLALAMAALATPAGIVVLAFAAVGLSLVTFREEIEHELGEIQGAINDFTSWWDQLRLNVGLGTEAIKTFGSEVQKALSGSSRIDFFGKDSPFSQAAKLTAKDLEDQFGKFQGVAKTATTSVGELNTETGKTQGILDQLENKVKEFTGTIVGTNKPVVDFAELLGGGVANSAKQASDSIQRVTAQVDTLKRSIQAAKLKEGIDASIKAGDFAALEAQKQQIADITREGTLAGLDAAAKDSSAGKELADLEAQQVKDAIDRDVSDSLEKAHLDAVDSWEKTFQNAITGVSFDLKDALQNIAVGFAAELAGSIFGGLSDGFSGPQGLGKTLGKEIGKWIGLGVEKGVDDATGSGGGAAGGAGIAGAAITLGIIAAFNGASAFYGRITDKDASRFKTGNQNTKEGVRDAQIAGADTIGLGALGEIINKYFEKWGDGFKSVTDPAGFSLEKFQQVFGIFGTNNQDNANRQGIQELLSDLLKEATGGRGINVATPDGGVANLDVFNFLGGTSHQFDNGAGFDFFNSLDDDARATFDGLALAFAEIFNLPDDFAKEQLSVLLAENLFGDIDNARLLMQELGLTLEEVKGALLDAANQGEISWLDFNVAVAGTADAFGEGRAALGDYAGAFDALVTSGGRGFEAVKAIRDIAIEAVEAGATSLDDLANRLLEAGYSAEDVQKFMDSLAGRGVTSLEQLVDASDELAGSIVGDLEAMGFGFAELSKDVDSVKQKFDELENFQFSPKRIELDYIEKNKPSDLGEPIQQDDGRSFSGDTSFDDSLPLRQHRTRRIGVEVSGGKGARSFVLNLDARGADVGVEQRLLEAISNMGENAVAQSVERVFDLQSRGRYGGGF